MTTIAWCTFSSLAYNVLITVYKLKAKFKSFSTFKHVKGMKACVFSNMCMYKRLPITFILVRFCR